MARSVASKKLMIKKILCQKLNQELDALERQPYPGELGKKIHASISKDAWGQWLQQQTMLINENRLASFDPQAKKFLAEEREKFLYGEGVAMPEDYVPPK